MDAVLDAAHFAQHGVVQMDESTTIDPIQEHLIGVDGELGVQAHEPGVQAGAVDGAVVAGALKRVGRLHFARAWGCALRYLKTEGGGASSAPTTPSGI